MTEFKIDHERYRGMTQQQAETAMEEDRQQAIAEDPRTVVAVRGQQERREARENEEIAAQALADMERRDAAEAELESYRERRLQTWVAQGGLEEHFAEIWPEIRREYLLEKARGSSYEEKLRRSNLSNMSL